MSDVRSRFSMSSGKKYFEIRLLAGVSNLFATVGIRSSLPSVGDLGYTSGVGWDSGSGDVYKDGLLVSATGVTGGFNPFINVALEFTGANMLVWMGRNNTWFSSGDPSTGANPLTTMALGTYYAAVGNNFHGLNVGCQCQLLATEDSQFYAAPTGFTAAALDTVTWGPVP